MVPESPGTRARALLALLAVGFLLLAAALVPLLSQTRGLLILAAVVAAQAAALIVWNPHWGVFAIVGWWFAEISGAMFGVSFFTPPYLITGVLVIPLARRFFQDRGIWVLRQVPQVKILMALGLLFLISTAWSDYVYPFTVAQEEDQTFRMLQLFFVRLGFLVFFLYFINTRIRIEIVVWLVVGLIFVAALTSLPDALSGGLGPKRASATFSPGENANRLAFMSLFAASLLWFHRVREEQRRWKFLTVPMLFVLPITALAAGSRNGFVQLLLLGVLALREQRGWSIIKRVRSVALVVSIAVLTLAMVPTFQLIRATNFDPGRTDLPGQRSLQNRRETVVAGLAMLADHPILGVGIGNFSLHYRRGRQPHNSYIWAATAGGIPALFLYLLLYFVTYRMLRRLERAGPPDLVWLCTGLRVGLILFLFFTLFADFWLSEFPYIVVGLTVAMNILARQRISVSAPASRLPLAAAA